MKAFLTLCFYEYPAAMPHINMWEKLMEEQNRIVHKGVNEDVHHISFIVKRDEDYECLICIPTDDDNYHGLLRIGNRMLLGISQLVQRETEQQVEIVEYLKTLIFGKVDQQRIQNIQKTMEYFESIKYLKKEINHA